MPDPESTPEPERLRTIFDGLFKTHPAHVALLDLQANILAVNDAWVRFGRANGLRADYDFGRSNYLHACEPAADAGDDYARDAYTGLLQVMRSSLARFTLVYPCHAPAEQRWFRLWVQPQRPAADAIVVAHKWLGKTRPSDDKEDDAVDMGPVATTTLDAQAEAFRALARSGIGLQPSLWVPRG
jgi:hypothetical protein